MSRLNILTAGILLLVGGGGLYGGLRLAGLETQMAQSGISVLLMLATVGWAVFYVGRVVTGKMTFHSQRDTYRKEMIKQKLAAMTPEQLAALEMELAQEGLAEDLAQVSEHPENDGIPSQMG